MATSLEGNKIVAGILAAGLLAMVSGKVADVLLHPKELEQNVYQVEVPEEAGTATAGQQQQGPTVEPVVPLLADADPAAGESQAKKCAACHTFDQGGANKIGPNLYGIVGAPKAHVDGFSYSEAMQSFSDPKEWTYESLNEFLYKPSDYIKGTKMNFAGIKKASDRADLIAYLRTLSDNPPPLPSPDQAKSGG